MAEEEAWAPIPKIRPVGSPVGLECLLSADQVIVGFGHGSKHSVNNIRGQKLFSVVDGSNCCLRSFCCDCSSFQMQLLDHRGDELITLCRSRACRYLCCSVRALPEMRVYAPPDNYIGRVKQTSGLFRRSFAVRDIENQCLLTLTRCNTSPTEYKVMQEQRLVGRMSKAWADLDRIQFGKQTLVGISFPQDLDVRVKMILISSCFLAYKDLL